MPNEHGVYSDTSTRRATLKNIGITKFRTKTSEMRQKIIRNSAGTKAILICAWRPRGNDRMLYDALFSLNNLYLKMCFMILDILTIGNDIDIYSLTCFSVNPSRLIPNHIYFFVCVVLFPT